MTELSTPHGDRLTALLKNDKLPEEDRPQVEKTIERYQKWRPQLQAVSGTYQEMVTKMVDQLNEYKRYVELELIFDSYNNHLH